jgi:hypothetical protein
VTDSEASLITHRHITLPGPWIRYPDEEFASREAEQANYRRVSEANDRNRGRIWTADDYREFHTVAAFRSALDPRKR